MGRVSSLSGSIAAGLVTLGLLASPAVAGAHLRSGTVAVDYRASLVQADTSAYSAQIFQSDRALSLTVKPGHAVELLGYLGEPVFRLGAGGLRVNAASPTAAVLRLITKSQRVMAPAPHWRLEHGKRSVIWPDARAQVLPPGVSRGAWSVPLIVDGQRTHLVGDLRRLPAPAVWPWVGLLAVLLALGLSPLALGRRDLAGPAAIGCGLAAAGSAAVLLVGFALDAYASPGTWIVALDALAFLGVGVWGLRRGPEHLKVAAAAWLGLVGLAVAALGVAVFLHPVVLAVLPGTVIRIVDVVAIGAGLGAAALGGAYYVETGFLTRDDDAELGMSLAGASPH